MIPIEMTAIGINMQSESIIDWTIVDVDAAFMPWAIDFCSFPSSPDALPFEPPFTVSIVYRVEAEENWENWTVWIERT